MLPRVAPSSPDSRLMSVVLPAPLGPSTACSLPFSSSIATSLTAINPPNRRQRPCVASIESLIVAAADQRALEARRYARKTAGQEDHQRDDRGAEQKLPMRSHRRVDLLQRDERERADNRSVQAALPAQYQHQQHVARLMPRQKLRVDESELQRRQIAGEP